MIDANAGAKGAGEVLVVEDTAASLRLLCDLLGGAGYSVRKAPNGELGLWTAQMQPPELILLDVRLPDIDGFEVCRRLKANPLTANIPVIFLSAQHETEDKVHGFQIGAVDYIGKPYQAEEILARVKTHVTMARLREALEAERSQLEEHVRQRTAELRAANMELEVSLRDLAKRNEDLEVFAYVAAHDLREPLRTVSTYVTMLEKRYADKLDEDGRTFIGFARDAAKRSNQLVLDLLEYSRTGRSEEAARWLDVGGIVTTVVTRLGQLVKDTHARIAVTSALPSVYGREEDLSRLFQNLIDNGLKHRHPDRPPAIEVSARQDGGEWVFCVRDNGSGIEPEYFEKVFVLFQRLDPLKAPEGTGIGLSVCRKLVEGYGGRIWVESKPGEGSAFRFTLPQCHSDAAQSEVRLQS